MLVLSCDFDRLYARGGWYGEDDVAEASAAAGPLARWIADIYPAYTCARRLPAAIASPDPHAAHALQEHYRALDERFRVGPGSALFCFEPAMLLDRTLYVPHGHAWATVYETHRPFERELKTVAPPSGDVADALAPKDDCDYLYIGSVGSENYGHWIIDDVARAAVLTNFGIDRPAKVLLDRYYDAVDVIRAETIARAIGSHANVTLDFIDKKRPYFFKRLYYVSPHSYQAILKSPAALAYARAALGARDGGAPLRLFVDREGLWRNLQDAAAIAEMLAKNGFVRVSTGAMTVAAQAGLFSRATTIVGVIGAAMVNTLFTPAGADVTYLAPEGFIDPFYWDLAQANGHTYRVIYGTPHHPHRPNFSSFALGDAGLATLSTWVHEVP